MSRMAACAASLVLALASLAPRPVAAQDECHVSPVEPIVTSWEVGTTPGHFTLALTLAPRHAQFDPPGDYFDGRNDSARWFINLSVNDRTWWGRAGEDSLTMVDAASGQIVARVPLTIGDYTVSASVPWAAGKYTIDGSVGGRMNGEADVCHGDPLHSTTVTVPGVTSTIPATLGSIRARWSAR